MHSKEKRGGILRSLGNRMRLLNILGSMGGPRTVEEGPVCRDVKGGDHVIETVEPLDLDFSDRDPIPFPEYCDKSLTLYKTKCKSESEIGERLRHSKKSVDQENIFNKTSDELTTSLTDTIEADFLNDFEFDEIDKDLSSRFDFSSNPEFSRLCFDYDSIENSPSLPSKLSHSEETGSEDSGCERNSPETQRNDREEIRKKLAMATDVEEDCFSEDMSYKKTSSSRALTGKNLQICFMNEDQDVGQPESSANSEQQEKPVTVPKPQTKSKEDPIVTKETTTKKEEDEDFFQRRARLQREAKMALAQASTMAHMQLEVERQQKKKSSPIVEIVGIPYIGDNRHQRVGLKLLHEMNVAQLQVVVNDLHTQIENLNEELVRLLMERDELHMSQDSMLVDIEDLTRRAEETAVRVNTKQTKTHSKS